MSSQVEERLEDGGAHASGCGDEVSMLGNPTLLAAKNVSNGRMTKSSAVALSSLMFAVRWSLVTLCPAVPNKPDCIT